MGIIITILCVAVIVLIIATIWIAKQIKKNDAFFYPHCHECGSRTEREWICDRCDQFYCDSCSAPFTYMNQIDYPCCESCSNVYYD